MQVRFVSIFWATLCCAPLALAQGDNFTITGANPDGYYLGNNPAVYVDPYTATVTGPGVNYSGFVICDDYTDEVTVPESWTVDSSTIGAGGATNGLFQSDNYSYTLGSQGFSYSGEQGYNMVAYLADELMTNENYNNQATADALSYAIWTIFTPSAYSNITGDTSVQAAVVQDIESAWTNAGKNSDYSGPAVTVWTPTSWNGDPSRPQEFLTVQTPEPPALASLAVDFTVLLGFLCVVRRRILRRVKA